MQRVGGVADLLAWHVIPNLGPTISIRTPGAKKLDYENVHSLPLLSDLTSESIDVFACLCGGTFVNRVLHLLISWLVVTGRVFLFSRYSAHATTTSSSTTDTLRRC